MSNYLSVSALIWAIGLIVLGALVSSTNASEQCSGWPLCNGQLSPAADVNGTLIFGHRFGGFVILLLSAGLVAISQARLRNYPRIGKLALTAFTIVLLQSVVGGFSVVQGLPSYAVAGHLFLALAVTGAFTTSVIVIRALLQPESRDSVDPLALPKELAGPARAIALLTPVVVVLASFVETSGLSALTDVGAPGGASAWLLILGGIVAMLSGVLAAGALRSPSLTGASRLIATGAPLSVLAGMSIATVIATTDVPNAMSAAALGLIGLGWAGIVASTSSSLVQSPAIPSPDRAAFRSLLRDFARVTKPGIMLLLLVTTLGAMLIAAQGWPSPGLVLLTMLGGALASGGASALNCYYDRDIDGVMARTRKRPIPTGGLSPDQVRAWGLTLSVLSVGVLAAFVNPLAAIMALSGNLFYVLIYTRKLKRTTPQNIVIGGAAGSFPPLVGWAAVNGSLSLGAFLIAAIVFYWTPPHFWSLALLKANDYRRAGIPMLPVTHGDHETRRRIVLYSFLLLGVTMLMVPAGVVGWIYGITAAVLGVWFVVMAVRMFREDTSRLAWPLFKYSNYYLAALLAAMAVDHAF